MLAGGKLLSRFCFLNRYLRFNPPISFWQKSTALNCKSRKAAWTTFLHTKVDVKCWWNWHLAFDTVAEDGTRERLVGAALAVLARVDASAGLGRVGVALALRALARAVAGALELIVGTYARLLVLVTGAVIAGPVLVAVTDTASTFSVAGTKLSVRSNGFSSLIVLVFV